MRPLTYFNEFCSHQDRGDAGMSDYLTGCFYKWNALPEQEQQEYKERSKERYRQYRQDRIEWESKMLKAGRWDVVRHVTLKKFKRMDEHKKKLKSIFFDEYSENKEE